MFEYDLNNLASWRNYNAPHLNPRIPEELLAIGGVNAHGQPRLRAVWGGEEQAYYEGDGETPEGWYLKYHLCFVRHASFREEIGLPRWIIEMWRDAGDFDGYYAKEGYYHLLTVQRMPVDAETGRGPYREIGDDILDTLRGMVHYMENNSEGESEAQRSAFEWHTQEQKRKDTAAIWS